MPNSYPTLGAHCLAPLGAATTGARAIPRICQTCLGELEQMIRALPDDHQHLTNAIGRRTQTADGPANANKPQSTPPINLQIDAVRTRLVYTAALWEEILRDHCRLSPRRTGTMREKQSLIQSVRILAPRINVLAALPQTDGYFNGPECGMVRRDGMEGLRDMARLHTGIQHTLGHTTATIRLPGICSCGAQQLTRQTGTDTVTCTACGGAWTYAEYTANIRMLIGGLI